jgi:hypothetical protein
MTWAIRWSGALRTRCAKRSATWSGAVATSRVSALRSKPDLPIS